ncbi:MAG TPA: hypothetical protein VFC63_03430 [Blastocatellia bacterium]|nr:hypothetical protein [Blastocatellia bacterium]
MAMNPEQISFDDTVERYNKDYLAVLETAASGDYNNLIFSCLILRDLYEAIVKLADLHNVEFNTVPCPFTFRPPDNLLIQYGFDEQQIRNIREFSSFVRRTEGKELEDCLAEGVMTNSRWPAKSAATKG